VTAAGTAAGSAADAIARVRDMAAMPGKLLLVSDFDGTLSPIVREPMGARIVPAARRALRRLARLSEAHPERLRVVILSGRSARDVAGRVRVGGLTYQGNHGIEAGVLPRGARAEHLEVAADDALTSFVDGARALGVAVADRLRNPGWLFVEDKGPTVAFHFRQAPDPDQARAAVLAAIADVEAEIGNHGLTAFEGRKVVEFRPIGAGAKGTAVERLIERERPGAVVVLGDDRSDAEAFAAVQATREAGRIRALIAAVHGATETPPEVLAHADVELPNPAAAARFLTALATVLERDVATRSS